MKLPFSKWLLIPSLVIMSLPVFAQTQPQIHSRGAVTTASVVVIRGKIESAGIKGSDVVMINGRILSKPDSVDPEKAGRMVEYGFGAIPKKDVVISQNCEDGIYVVTAEEGNFIAYPDHSEAYLVPLVLNVFCLDNVGVRNEF